MKIIKWLVIIVSVLLLAALVAGIIFIRSFDINSYKPMAEKAVTDVLGREFKINGDIKMALALSPTIVVEDVTLANAHFGTAKDMASLKRLAVKFALADILKGTVKVDNIEADNLFLLLETDRKRNPNWVFTPQNEDKKDNKEQKDSVIEKEMSDLGLDLSYAFGDILVQNAKVVYLDGTTGAKTTVDLAKVYANANGNLAINGTINGEKVSVEGKSADIAGILNGVKEFPLNLQIVYAANTATVKGVIKDIESLSGIDIAVTAEGKNIPVVDTYQAKMLLSGSVEDLGVKDIELSAGKPESFLVDAKGKIGNVHTMAGTKINMIVKALNADVAGIKPFTLTVDVNEVKGMSAVNTLINFTAGESSVSGSVNADISGKKPNITANLTSPLFRIDDIVPDSAYAGAAQPSSAGTKNAKEEESLLVFSDEPLPWVRLSDVNVKAKAVFDKIVIPDVSQTIKTSADLSLQDSVLKLDVLSSSAAKDSLQTDLYVNASALDTADITLKLAGKNIVLGQLLHKILQGKVQGGNTNIDLDLKTKGDSVHILMSNMDGQVTLVMEDAKVQNEFASWLGSDVLVKIVNMVKGIVKPTTKDKQNDVQCVVANFKVKEGKTVLNKGVALETKSAFVVLDGDVDFGNERMNLSLATSSPDALSTGVTNLLTGMIKIDGSFSEPAIGIDSKGVVGAAATVGAALMTGGVSYIGQRLVSTTVADISPCVTALGKPLPSGKGAKKTAKKTTKKTVAKETTTSETQKEKNSDYPVEALKSLVNNIF